MAFLILIRGGGDIASGVALRLYKAGLSVVITELAQPLAVRRLVSFAEAVYSGETTVEGIAARRISDPADTLSILMVLSKGKIPVLVDPEGDSVRHLHPSVVIDARMLKQLVELDRNVVPLLIGLGPGFVAGLNCHAIVETNRGHRMGRVIWQGAPEPNTGIPESVPFTAPVPFTASISDWRTERVLRAPVDGELVTRAEIGEHLEQGQLIAEVDGQPNVLAVPSARCTQRLRPIHAPFGGVLRGMLHAGVHVQQGMKIGDVDPRDDPHFCTLVSDKALAIGGAVLEAILSRPNLRPHLWK